jgi:zinc finger protein
MTRAFLDEAHCPACENVGLEYNAETIDLPYLGESLETMLRCLKCGYRHTDFILTEVKDAIRATYTIDDEAAMSVRVVRSSSGTVRIPELGIEIEPGIASDAYISNIEGIFVRIESVLDQLFRDAEGEKERLPIQKLIDILQAARNGAADSMTLIIEDPFGNSAIISKETKVEKLSMEEAEKLKTGGFVFDSDGNFVGP